MTHHHFQSFNSFRIDAVSAGCNTAPSEYLRKNFCFTLWASQITASSKPSGFLCDGLAKLSRGSVRPSFNNEIRVKLIYSKPDKLLIQ